MARQACLGKSRSGLLGSLVKGSVEQGEAGGVLFVAVRQIPARIGKVRQAWTGDAGLGVSVTGMFLRVA